MLKKKKFLRITGIALGTFIIFNYLLIPLRIEGRSMEPGYRDGGFRLCWRLHYLLSEPRRGDVVAIRFAGKRIVLLKRIVALSGDTVEFRNGTLLVNNRAIEEPYVYYDSRWNLSSRRVDQNKVYVVGDNRGVPMEQHHFGQVSTDRLLGGVL